MLIWMMYHTCNNIIIHDEETKGMTAMANLGSLWNSIQTWLFPMLEDELGELDEKHREFVVVCEFCSPRAYMASYRWVGNGCPPASRLALCKAFIAKAVWDFPTTRGLSIKILCKSSPKHCSTWDSSCPHSLPQHRFMRFCKRLNKKANWAISPFSFC